MIAVVCRDGEPGPVEDILRAVESSLADDRLEVATHGAMIWPVLHHEVSHEAEFIDRNSPSALLDLVARLVLSMVTSIFLDPRGGCYIVASVASLRWAVRVARGRAR